LVRERVEGSRLDLLAGYGPLWRGLWTHVLTTCPLFGLLYHHLLPEVVDTEDNRPIKIFACLFMEYYVGAFLCH
jgi:hypothetical protein